MALKQLTALALVAVACGDSGPYLCHMPDQELRRKLFLECLERVPAGPTSVATSNDWAEVVEECDDVALSQSHRWLEWERATGGHHCVPKSRDGGLP